MDFEKLAEKIVPTVLLIIVGSIFAMYMDVAGLKMVAKDSVERSTSTNIQQSKDILELQKEMIRLKCLTGECR